MSSFREILARDVRKVFGRRLALAGVTCTLRQGQVSLVVGHNGAGKSTLLSILATLSRPTSGEVLYGDMDARTAEARLRGRIGLLDHAPMLYRQLTARENLAFFAGLYGVADPAGAADAWLRRVGLPDDGDRPVRQLSRGMVQRVALARALLHDPAVLLLDEPFTGLDRDGVRLLRQEIARSAAEGKIVALTTHDIDAVDGLCQHLIVLRHGRVASDIADEAIAARRIQEHYGAAA